MATRRGCRRLLQLQAAVLRVGQEEAPLPPLRPALLQRLPNQNCEQRPTTKAVQGVRSLPHLAGPKFGALFLYRGPQCLLAILKNLKTNIRPSFAAA
jgi:hypothetical protein